MENSRRKKGGNLENFASVLSDPKFKPIPKKIKKCILKDKRFEKMFTDENFNNKLRIDEYGFKKKEMKQNDFEELYMMDDEDNGRREKNKGKDGKGKKKEKGVNSNKNPRKTSTDSNISSDTSEEFQEFLEEIKRPKIYEKSPLKNSSNSKAAIKTSEESSENSKSSLNSEAAANEEEKPPTGDETSRFAVMNIDWGNIHALDLFVLFNSFCEEGQKVLKVEIYPSEFGMKEMEKENEMGPDKRIFGVRDSQKNEGKNNPSIKNNEKNNNKEDDDDNNDSEIEYNEEGFDPVELRKYELKKLKYYYAVVYCDSVQTASHLYEECDGQEIDRTQSFMDLRFIPDSLTSFPYPPKETCDSIPVNKEYEPNFKPNSALQDTKVKLTWDDNDPRREDLIKRAFKEGFDGEDIKELLESSESDEEEGGVDEEDGEEGEEESKDGGGKEEELELLKKKRKQPKFKDGETIVIKFNKGFDGLNPGLGQSSEKEKDGKSKWEKFKEEKKNKRRERKQKEKIKKLKIKESREKQNKKEQLELLVGENKEGKKEKIEEKNSAEDDGESNKKRDKRFDTRNNTDFAIDPTNKNYKKYKNNL